MSIPTLDAEYAELDPLQVRIDTHRRYSETPDDVNAAVTDALALTGTEHLLDVGCGTGEFLTHLVESGHTGPLIGLDTSQSATEAAARLHGVEAIHAPAEDIPLPDSACDVVTARHMLYHLPDPMRGLREFRRVVKPGGTVCVVVNHPDTCPNTRAIVTKHARAYGLRPPVSMTNHADSDTLPDMMQDVYRNATIRRFDNALVIPDIDPLVRFARALGSFCGIAPDSPHRAAIFSAVEAELRQWFTDHPGQPWRDPKGYTVITATRQN